MQSQEISTQGKVQTPDLAKGKNKQLTFTLFVAGSQVDTLTAKQRELMAKRLSKTISLYYSSHSEEYRMMKE